MFQMEQIPGDFCADNLALILKAKGVSVLAEHLQLFTTSLQANIKLIGQEMRDQKIKKRQARAICLNKLLQADSSGSTWLV